MNKKMGVKKCAKLLDREHPGWHKKINIPLLDMTNIQYCVLGQLYGFSAGLEKLGHLQNCPYGFTASAPNTKWIKQITKRLHKDKPKPKFAIFKYSNGDKNLYKILDLKQGKGLLLDSYNTYYIRKTKTNLNWLNPNMTSCWKMFDNLQDAVKEFDYFKKLKTLTK